MKSQIEKAGLFIEDDDYENLVEILKYFAQYEIGKKVLIEFRQVNHAEDYAIVQMIEGNRDKKIKYDTLIIKIKGDLRKQIKGE